MKEVFAIIGKLPQIGFSKTRLAREIGDKQAYDIYEAFLNDFFLRFGKIWNNKKLYFFGTPSGDSTEKYFKKLFEKFEIKNPKYIEQPEIPFFVRLKFIFDFIHREEKNAFIHLTGTDIPDFPFDILENINISKDTITIGPDTDGGYYYLGGSSKHSKIFAIDLEENHSKSILEKTCEIINRMELNVNIIKNWSDIDTKEDLRDCLNRSKVTLIPETYTQASKIF